MKRFLALGGLMLALNSYSQSYLVLNNGITLTTDNAGFIYDFGHFIPPYKVTLSGGQFFAEEEKLLSVDTKGFLYRKDEKAPKKLKGKGLNYLLSDNGIMTTFDASGFMYKFDKDANLKKAVGFGGNFFTVKIDDKKSMDLYTVNNKGNYFKMVIDGLNPAEILNFGGSYFVTSKKVIYTVNKDGFVFAKPEVKTAGIKKFGGNFFVDANNMIYTISEEGFLMLPSLPEKLVVANIMKAGSNYFLDKDGNLFAVDQTGAIYERIVKDHDLKTTNILSM